MYFLTLNKELKDSNLDLKAEVTQIKSSVGADKVKIVNSARKKVNRAPAVPNENKITESVQAAFKKENDFETMENSDLNEQIFHEKLIEDHGFTREDLQVIIKIKDEHSQEMEKFGKSRVGKPWLPHRELLKPDPFVEEFKKTHAKLKKEMSPEKYEAYMKVLDQFNIEMDRRNKNGEEAYFRYL